MRPNQKIAFSITKISNIAFTNKKFEQNEEQDPDEYIAPELFCC